MGRRGHLTILLVVLFIASVAAASAQASTPPGAGSPFCNRLGHSIEASSGAQMYCFGLQASGSPLSSLRRPATILAPPFTANVDAASLSDDVTPGGARLYGQSETSIAATGPYVVEAWNDATAFASPCPSPMYKEEGTGYGFSSNGGAKFTDLGGLPNNNCTNYRLQGDPSVEAWQPGGHAYFYITSLYPSFSAKPVNYIALNACQVLGSGSSAKLHCGQPIIAGASTQCASFPGPQPQFFCSFLDKEYLTIDPSRGRLYVTYTEFGPTPTTSSFNGQIELAVCDIGTPSGGTGPSGGTAAAPRCHHGTQASPSIPTTLPYMTLAPGNANCENEGSYPGTDTTSGDVYAAYEFNVPTNLFNPACFGTPTTQNLLRVPKACLVLATNSFCGAPATTTSEPVVSMDAAFIPGYNRFPANDFPRIAVDPLMGTVSMVWNDARKDALGDILLRSYALGTLAPIQRAPVVLNHDSGGLHYLPAVRNSSATGKLAVTWYDRATANTAITNVEAALSLDPRVSSTPSTNTLVTTAPTDWNSVSSDIVPNFGDYTDNYIVGGRVFVAWSDGRLGVPQPFEASAPLP